MSRSNRSARSSSPDESDRSGGERGGKLAALRSTVALVVALARAASRQALRSSRRRWNAARDADGRLPALDTTIRGPPDRPDAATRPGPLDSSESAIAPTAGLPATTADRASLETRREGDRLVIEEPEEDGASVASTVWVDVER